MGSPRQRRRLAPWRLAIKRHRYIVNISTNSLRTQAITKNKRSVCADARTNAARKAQHTGD